MNNEHQEIEMLLPWFVTGQLDAGEKAQVDAHVLVCPECRLLLAQEHRLKAEVAAIPVPVPQFQMQSAFDNRGPSIASGAWRSASQAVETWKAKPMRVAVFAAAQAAMLLIVFQLAQPTISPNREYRTLSSGEIGSKANAIIMFRDDTREADFRAILVSAGATIVGGPTESNIYYLRIEPGMRVSKLENLRLNSKILLAQSIDGE